MRKFIGSFCLVSIIIPFTVGCKLFDKNYEKIIRSDGSEETTKEVTIESLLEDGKEVAIIPNEWMEFCQKNESPGDVDKYNISGTEISNPESVVLRWTNKNETSKYTFLLATNKEMKESQTYEVDSTSVTLEDLFAGTSYYYQIKAHYDDYDVLSKRFEFKTYDYFRTLKIDGVLNARDLGSKTTNNGKKRVKQGLVYRSANFDSVKPEGITDAINKYGIKTDLDLREPGPTESPLGSNVQYINNGVGTYGSPLYVSVDNGINSTEYQPVMRDNLKVFANINNLPAVFHCAVGRDRTGTLATTLLLLLGVKVEQIKLDYAVSFFSRACNNYTFADYETSFEYLFKYFEHFKGGNVTDKSSIYDRAEQYCLHIGLTKNEISQIRSNLLEDIKK